MSPAHAVLLLSLAGACTGEGLDPARPAPFEVVSTGGRSFARVAPSGDEPEGAWQRLTPRTGAWVARSWTELDETRPFTVVSPEGACVGKVVAALELAREIGVRGNETAETDEPWDAIEVTGCTSYEGDRRIGLPGRVPDAKWTAPREDESLRGGPRVVGTLHAGARAFRIVEDASGDLAAIELAGTEAP